MEIVVDGLDITTHCDIKRSVFEMHAGPLPGTAKVYVRDLDHSLSIATGSEITLDIESLRVWGGYVMSITREYAFPVDDTSVPSSTPRYFVLDCSDYNILFSKRFIRNKAHETERVPKYPAGKHDDEIVLDLFHNYLDLEGDGLTHTKVRYVGTPQEDNPGSPAVPAMSWATAMRNTALMPGAIYYIDADKDLAYADVDVTDAPFALSDTPNGTTTFGYRDMAIVEDGTMLANDAFVWGTGLGQNSMTFKRYQEETSKAEHGLWQWSDYRQDLYKPQSVLKRATTYIDGSTQNNRGHKDPAITIRCTMAKPGLRAGMKVRFICGVHGFDDVIPVRSMRVRFVNNDEAMYDLVLAHYLDEAWNTAEFPPLKDDPETKDDRHCEQPVCGTGGPTDSFNRGMTGGWGSGEAGLAWYVNNVNLGVGGIQPDLRAYMYAPYQSQLVYTYQYFYDQAGAFDGVTTGTFDTVVTMQLEKTGANPATPIRFDFTAFENGCQVMLGLNGSGTLGPGDVRINLWGSTDPPTVHDVFDPTQLFRVRIAADSSGPTLSVKVWTGDPEPDDWTITATDTHPSSPRVLDYRLYLRQFVGGTNLYPKLWFNDMYLTVNGTDFFSSSVCQISHSYSPGSLTATAISGDQVVITEVDPEAGTFTYEPPGDIIVCYSENGTDTPPGGYGGGPVYRPRHVRQLGWGSSLDGENCTMASACIALDRHTEGAKTCTPPRMRSLQDDQTGGTDLNDAAVAWSRGFSETLDVHWGTSWSAFVSMINGGRGGILQGTYSRITAQYSSQTSFDGGHAMYINEFRADGYALVYDPLASAPKWMPASMLQSYAEAFGGGGCNVAYTRVTG